MNANYKYMNSHDIEMTLRDAREQAMNLAIVSYLQFQAERQAEGTIISAGKDYQRVVMTSPLCAFRFDMAKFTNQGWMCNSVQVSPPYIKNWIGVGFPTKSTPYTMNITLSIMTIGVDLEYHPPVHCIMGYMLLNAICESMRNNLYCEFGYDRNRIACYNAIDMNNLYGDVIDYNGQFAVKHNDKIIPMRDATEAAIYVFEKVTEQEFWGI